MRGLIYVIGFAAFTACSTSQPDEQPKIVAEKFLDAVSNHRFDEAKQYVTPGTKQMLEVQSSVSAMDPEKKKTKCNILSCTVDGNKAFVIYKRGAAKDAEILRLTKSSDSWLVGQ